MSKRIYWWALFALALLLGGALTLYGGRVSSSISTTSSVAKVEGAASLTADPRLAAACQQNPDTVAWLTVPGTNIDGPVQQAADNEYYLRRNALGQPDHNGCIYADYECDFDGAELSVNTVIYGHTFAQPGQDPDLGFGQLHRYLDLDFARENGMIYLSAQGQMFVYQVVSVGTGAADAEQVSILATPSWDLQQELVHLANERNVLPGTLEAAAGQKLLTLSTCTNDSKTRLLIVAELIGG